MTTTRTGPSDPADLAVVELLRDAGRGAPTSLDVDALLHRSRRSARNHRIATVAGGAGAAALLVAAAVGLGGGFGRPDAAPAPVPASQSATPTAGAPTDTPTGTSSDPAPTTVTSGPTATAEPGSLQAVLGDGWGAPNDTGDVTLAAGSAAADGLPAGFTAVASRFSVPATLSNLCRGFTEKNATFTPCTTRTAPDGTPVSRMVMDARLSPPASYASLRYLRDVGGGQVEVATISVTSSSTTPVAQSTYDAAMSWLLRYEDRLAAAVTVDIPPGQ